jgi:RES domain-containing protein
LEASRLHDAIDGLGPVAFSGVVYRHIGPTRDCLSGEGARAFGGRWNPPGSHPTLYTALSATTAASELGRLAARQGRALEDFLPRTLCRLQADLTSVIDLRYRVALDSVGLTIRHIRDDDPSRCQAVGAAVHALGYEGLLAESAVGAGHVLIIFPLNLADSSTLSHVASETWLNVPDIPA